MLGAFFWVVFVSEDIVLSKTPLVEDGVLILLCVFSGVDEYFLHGRLGLLIRSIPFLKWDSYRARETSGTEKKVRSVLNIIFD